MYTYRAFVRSVYDGDSFRADLDLGFAVTLENQAFRLHGVDCPEVRGDSKEAGIAARDFVRGLILDERVIVRTIKPRGSKGKYGRWLAFVDTDEGDLAKLLVEAGHAEWRTY